MSLRDTKTQEELDDAAIVDAVRSFIRVQERDWSRRQMNAMLPKVLKAVDTARANGERPDVKKIIEQAFTGRLLA